MAVPDRVNLFRAQTLRSVGANGWRMSHNPPTPVTGQVQTSLGLTSVVVQGLLDILDRTGTVVLDENRQGNSPLPLSSAECL